MTQTLDIADISFKIAISNQEFEDGKNLFQQYSNTLNLDLCFQDFTNELKTIHIQYNKPKGALLLAYNGKNAVGCVAIRELDSHTAELKRMFVLPEFRKCKIGKKFLELSIDLAREFKYEKIRLDTLPTMIEAQNLYRKFGFYDISPYRFNPINGAVFMGKNLTIDSGDTDKKKFHNGQKRHDNERQKGMLVTRA